MSIRRDKRWNTWFYRKQVRTQDGRAVRIFGTPKADGLPDTRAGAEEAERRAIARVLATGEAKKPTPLRKEVPTVREFSKTFIETSRVINKASSIDAKNAVLNCHLLPLIGDLPIDKLTYAVIEDLTGTPATPGDGRSDQPNRASQAIDMIQDSSRSGGGIELRTRRE